VLERSIAVTCFTALQIVLYHLTIILILMLMLVSHVPHITHITHVSTYIVVVVPVNSFVRKRAGTLR
jgi:hypothetical protein